MTIDHRAFRKVLGCFATGVTVVTTVTAPAGVPAGVTVSSFASVSLDPPLVLFSLDRGSAHLEAFSASGRFAVNILGETQQALSMRFAGAEADRWVDLAWQTGETGAPLIPGCIAALDCLTHALVDGGDHVIFIGRVVSASGDRDARPLLYHAGAYRHLTKD
jgi:flavin reductase (DIM6/NTAB) family NADH-FMN oxidoreductase RutF